MILYRARDERVCGYIKCEKEAKERCEEKK